jgi:hypothetical protein
VQQVKGVSIMKTVILLLAVGISAAAQIAPPKPRPIDAKLSSLDEAMGEVSVSIGDPAVMLKGIGELWHWDMKKLQPTVKLAISSMDMGDAIGNAYDLRPPSVFVEGVLLKVNEWELPPMSGYSWNIERIISLAGEQLDALIVGIREGDFDLSLKLRLQKGLLQSFGWKAGMGVKLDFVINRPFIALLPDEKESLVTNIQWVAIPQPQQTQSK